MRLAPRAPRLRPTPASGTQKLGTKTESRRDHAHWRPAVSEGGGETIHDEPTQSDDPLPPSDSDAWDAGLAAAFAEPDDVTDTPSVLARLERLTGRDARVLLRDAATDADPVVRSTDAAGERAGRYRILGEIARGGVGVILKGRDVDLGRDLAMKVLRDDHAGNAELIQRFVEEAQIGGQLEHPGIVPVYELGVDDEQRPYFTMKLIHGRTLARLLEERADPESDRVRFLRIFEQVCDAMGYAHARGVVHRDLKPANILVGSFGEVQVVDWGFAKVLARGGIADEKSAHVDRRDASIIATVRSGPDGMESQVGSVMGTPSYMPPEQARGKVDQLDERTDVFALGAILCEILTGGPPYVGETIGQTALKAHRAELGDALERLDGCGADALLVTLAKRCLLEEQTGRPRDAGQLAASIREHLASLETRAHDAKLDAARATARAEAERKSRRLTTVLGGAVIALVLAATGAFLVARDKHQERIDHTETQIYDALRAASSSTSRGEYELAEAAVERARALVASEQRHLGDDLKKRVEALGLETARALLEERLVARLAEVRASDELESDELDAAYTTVFAEFDMEIATATPEDIAARVGRDTPLARAVAFALDDWIWRRLSRGPRRGRVSEPLVAIAQHLDSDPWRHELRVAGAERDGSRLLALADEADPAALSALSQDTLALTLVGAWERERAVEVLAAAVIEHPDDFYLNFHLAAFLLFEGRDLERAERHALIALALRKESLATRMFLVGLYAEKGDAATARVYLDQIVERDPDSPRTQMTRIRVLQLEGDGEAALAVANELATTQPEFVPGHFLRARLLMAGGDEAAAREAVRTALAAAQARHGAERPERSGGSRGGARSGGRRRMRGDLDLDGDGRVSPKEAPESVRPYFDLLDRDADGALDPHEYRMLRFLMRGGPRENSGKPGTKPGHGRDQD